MIGKILMDFVDSSGEMSSELLSLSAEEYAHMIRTTYFFGYVVYIGLFFIVAYLIIRIFKNFWRP